MRQRNLFELRARWHGRGVVVWYKYADGTCQQVCRTNKHSQTRVAILVYGSCVVNALPSGVARKLGVL